MSIASVNTIKVNNKSVLGNRTKIKAKNQDAEHTTIENLNHGINKFLVHNYSELQEINCLCSNTTIKL